MTRHIALTFRRGDWAAIGLTALLAAAVLLGFAPGRSARGAVAQVYLDGELVREQPLDADASFIVEGAYRNEVRISDGRAAIVWSDCPGGDCVRMGSISAAGRSIVCLPNRVEVRVLGGDTDDVDMVAG